MQIQGTCAGLGTPPRVKGFWGRLMQKYLLLMILHRILNSSFLSILVMPQSQGQLQYRR